LRYIVREYSEEEAKRLLPFVREVMSIVGGVVNRRS
jgi:HEPN domain-containing protein